MKEGVANNECVTGQIDRKELKSAKWRLAIDSKACAQNLESTIHAVEHVPCDTPGEPAQFIPIRFIFTNKLSRHDKLMLAFDALVLSETLGRKVDLGKILHGDDLVTLRVKTSALDSEVRKITATIATLLSGRAPPDLVLNRHCAECEFQKQCRQKAIEKDDLSLLVGITEDERNRYCSKGIFTVTQLSYTFRPRRTPKRAKNPARPRYPALQALAIRENTVYIHGTPELPDSKTRAYLDIEGIPDSDSYYLIGILIVSEGQETFHSFWADLSVTGTRDIRSLRRSYLPLVRVSSLPLRGLRLSRPKADQGPIAGRPLSENRRGPGAGDKCAVGYPSPRLLPHLLERTERSWQVSWVRAGGAGCHGTADYSLAERVERDPIPRRQSPTPPIQPG